MSEFVNAIPAVAGLVVSIGGMLYAKHVRRSLDGKLAEAAAQERAEREEIAALEADDWPHKPFGATLIREPFFPPISKVRYRAWLGKPPVRTKQE